MIVDGSRSHGVLQPGIWERSKNNKGLAAVHWVSTAMSLSHLDGVQYIHYPQFKEERKCVIYCCYRSCNFIIV